MTDYPKEDLPYVLLDRMAQDLEEFAVIAMRDCFEASMTSYALLGSHICNARDKLQSLRNYFDHINQSLRRKHEPTRD